MYKFQYQNGKIQKKPLMRLTRLTKLTNLAPLRQSNPRLKEKQIEERQRDEWEECFDKDAFDFQLEFEEMETEWYEREEERERKRDEREDAEREKRKEGDGWIDDNGRTPSLWNHFYIYSHYYYENGERCYYESHEYYESDDDNYECDVVYG